MLRLPYPVGDFIIATPTPYDTSSKIGFWEIQAQQVQMFNKSYAAKINPQIWQMRLPILWHFASKS